MTMKDYPCAIFGELRIPYYSLFEDPSKPYTEKEVKIHIDDKPFVIPDENVRKYHEKIIEKKEREAEEKGKVFFDGPLVKLKEYIANEDNHALDLYLKRTSFFTYVSTNKSLDVDLVWKMVKERGAEYTNLDDGLANPIGCNVLTLTSDGYVVLNKRSDKISVYPGLYGILPAGFATPDKDNYNPFKTAKREAVEEMGVPIKEPELLGFGRAGDDRHIEFLFLVETEHTGLEVKSAPKSEKYEAKEVILAEFTPKLAHYITRTVSCTPKGAIKRENTWVQGRSPAWVPAQVYLLIQALIKEYGFDRVFKAINDAFTNYTKPVA